MGFWTHLTGGRAAALTLLLLVSLGCRGTARVANEVDLHKALDSGATRIQLAGTITLTKPILVPASTQPIEIRGPAELRLNTAFMGPAAILSRSRSNLVLSDLIVEGDRPEHPATVGLPPSNVSFARFYKRNGIVVEGGEDIVIQKVRLSHITDFAIIVSGARRVRIEEVTVEDSGGVNDRGRNNTSGGILLEEGTSDFEVRRCTIRRVLGNAIWTHSNAGPRSARGIIADNTIVEVARDAIQVGHATEVIVENNIGERIGYPPEFVDAETHAVPVALDTAGNVDRTAYRNNRFHDVNGECINLDGFHHGEVRGNICESTRPFDSYPHSHYGIVVGNSDPDMKSKEITIAGNRLAGFGYGGLYLIGTGHTITGNRFLMLNRARCTGDGKTARCNYALDQPDMLRSGIYLAGSANRKSATEANTIRGNEISGFGMGQWCIRAAPGVSIAANHVGENSCIEESQKR